jgi:gamma-glutamyl-gamma-aminobutyrate hydrolase PuuD
VEFGLYNKGMNKYFVSLLLFVGLSASSLACELPKGESLKIGCTYNCDLFYRFRVIMTAWMMGYKVSFFDLQREADVRKGMERIDAILIPGGADIDPGYYLDAVTPELREYTKKNLHLVNFSEEGKRRDPFEFKLIKTYSEDNAFKDIPMLGICRGLQMMSVVQGIPLYLDLKTELGIKNRYHTFDRISLMSNSLIGEIYPQGTVKGFKLHHQGIRIPYFEQNASRFPQARVTAYSHNRMIAEAIEYTHRPALGVQYHPEKSFSGASVPVFQWFLHKACEYKKSKELK